MFLFYNKKRIVSYPLYISYYSLLNANTGSFLAACFDGIKPPIKVNITLNITNIVAATVGKTAVISSFTLWITILVGINSKSVTTIPIIPENNPAINVSALKIEDILRLEAPIALNIPISFVLYKTEM